MEYVLGVDGGGSKVVCLAADSRGRLLGYGVGGPVNTNFISRQSAIDALCQAVDRALAQADLPGKRIARLCISAPCEPSAVDAAMHRCGIHQVLRAAEGDTPRWAARFWIQGRIGLTVDAGTGSLARGWSADGRVASAGGWGSTLGDEGSGYWIGLQAMRAVVQLQDGRIAPTRLAQRVLDHFGMVDVLDLVFRATQGLAPPESPSQYAVAPDSGMGHDDTVKQAGGYRFRALDRQRTLTRAEVASLSPLVVQLAQQGDWKARAILKAAGNELALLGLAVVKRLQMEADEFVAVPFGGVFQAGRLVLRAFSRRLSAAAAQAQIVVPRYEPVVGAVLLALNDLGIGIGPEVLHTLDSTALNIPACHTAPAER